MSKLAGKKRPVTTIGSIEKDYGVDFGVRSDMTLVNYLKKEGLPSLSRAVKYAEKALGSR